MTGDEDDICSVHVDGVPVCSTSCLEKAILLFVAVYYVFNIVLCKHAIKTIIYIVKFACKIDGDTHDVHVWRAYKQCMLLFEKVVASRGVRKGRIASKEREDMAAGETSKQPEKHVDDKVGGGVDEIVEPARPLVQRKRSSKTQHSGGSEKKGKGCSRMKDDTTGVLTDKTNKAVRTLQGPKAERKTFGFSLLLDTVGTWSMVQLVCFLSKYT